MPQKRKPSYLLHKPTGQARVRLDGKDIYLGEYGSPESRERYEQLVADWFVRSEDAVLGSMTVDDLAVLYLKHAERHYRKNGKPTPEISCIRIALRVLISKHGRTRAREFGPRALKTVRDAIIEKGYMRKSINVHVGRIRRMFKWAAENEYVDFRVFVQNKFANTIMYLECEPRTLSIAQKLTVAIQLIWSDPGLNRKR